MSDNSFPPRSRPEHGAFRPVNNLHSTAEPSFPLRPTSGNKIPSGAMDDQKKKPVSHSSGFSVQRKDGGDLGSFHVPAAKSTTKGPTSPGFDSIQNARARQVHNAAPAANFHDIMADYGGPPRPAGNKSNQGVHMQQLGGGIARPVNGMPPAIPAAPRPTFSSGGFNPVNAGAPKWSTGPSQTVPINNFIDLTKDSDAYRPLRRGDGSDDDDDYDPTKAMGGDRFNEFDPRNYMDSAQANENIQKLLEGAFEEDDEDKPKTRLRRRKQTRVNEDSAADRLAAKLKDVSLTKDDKKEAEQDEDEEDDGCVDGLTVKLLPHQIDGLSWMMDKEVGERKKNGVLPKGGILADDMGLGKTIQAISLILSNPRPTDEWIEENPKKKFPKSAGKGTLVVAPLALIKQWESEIKEKVTKEHRMKVLVHHGPSRTKRIDDLKKYDIVITTYQTLTSENDGTSMDEGGIKVGCFGVHWLRVILDEAHSIKNRNAKMSKAACNLKAVYRWCLTGTPMQNNLDELQSLIHFLRIKPYQDLRVWKDQISGPMKNGRGGLAMKRLQYFLKAFMKRRTKDVLKQSGALKFGKAGSKEGQDDDKREGFKIVARTVETVETNFSESEREFYDRLAARTEKSLDQMMDGKKDYIGALVLLLRLRQMCNHPDLIKGNLKKEEPVTTGSGSGNSTQRGKDDVDDVADLFGGLSVETKKCDVCQIALSKDEASAGNIRCTECEADIGEHEKVDRKKSKKSKPKKRHSKEVQQQQRRRRVIDSDDEDEDDAGEWIVPPSEQQASDLGKAGGQDDEDAEGGGDWTRSDEERSEADEDESRQDSFISHDTDDRKYFSASDSEDDAESLFEERAVVAGITASTKIRHLLSILGDEVAENKTIVFSEFTSMLDLIGPHLRGAGIQFVRYDGKMSNPDREASLHALRTDKRVRVLLCSLRCGALGLNLTAACRVVLMEPFWNPFVEEQAIDRVHRLNQTRDVRVYRLTVKNTVEERILALQERKRELARAAIEGGAAGGKGKMNLSMSDVLALFKRDAADVADDSARALGQGGVRVLPTGGTTSISSAPPAAATKENHRIVSGGSHSKDRFDAVNGRRW